MFILVFYRIMPRTQRVDLSINFTRLKSILPFAIGLSYSFIIWVFVSQSDKLVFSSILPLSEYGYHALIVMVAGSVLQLSSPVSVAVT